MRRRWAQTDDNDRSFLLRSSDTIKTVKTETLKELVKAYIDTAYLLSNLSKGDGYTDIILLIIGTFDYPFKKRAGVM